MALIIYPPTIDWTYMRQRPQHLMNQFAKDAHTVLFFNKSNYPGNLFEEVEQNLFVINHAQFFLDHILPLLTEKKLYWTSWSKKIPFARNLQASHTVYDCVDDFPDWEEEEKKWIHEVDFIICTASLLMKKMKRLSPSTPIALVPNGCDWEFFNDSRSISIDSLEGLPQVKGPKIGYIGAWAPWVDQDIIAMLSDRFPTGQILIVGPMLTPEKIDKPNIYYLGYRDYQELPAILAYFDICIIPFKLNRITESTNPVKVYEYLSAGKSVVSTNLPELKKMNPYVDIGATPEIFVSLVSKAIKYRKNPFYLASYAKQFSWEERYKSIIQSVSNNFPDVHMKDPHTPILLRSSNFEIEEQPLNHSTVNSYYETKNLKQDPPFIGEKPLGIYQCYLQSATNDRLSDYQHIYLDFDMSYPPVLEEVKVAISYTPENWNPDTISFENKPAVFPYKEMAWKEGINTTYSVEITELVSNLGKMPNFHLSSSSNCHIRLGNPRLSYFRKI
ncbi:MAG: glycosyltransferase [Bacillota bacterium]